MEYRKLKNSELDRKTVEHFKEAEKLPVSIILDNVRSAHNIGSVFRTADAFLLKKIYLCGVCATPPDKGIRKTALGATQSVDWEYAPDTVELIKNLQQKGIQIISIEQAEKSTMLNDFQPVYGEEYALIFGNEIKGVQQEVVNKSDKVIEIPQLGTKHSLNIAVSTGIVSWDIFSKLLALKKEI